MLVSTGVGPQVNRSNAGLPCAMVLTAYSALSLVTGLCCHHHPRHAARMITNSNASVGASGPHGFAVRQRRASSRAPPRPPHSAPDTRDAREAPLLRRERNAAVIVVILVRREAKSFRLRGWTGAN